MLFFTQAGSIDYQVIFLRIYFLWKYNSSIFFFFFKLISYYVTFKGILVLLQGIMIKTWLFSGKVI